MNTDRNLHPSADAQVAMIIWGREYSQQSGGSMDFWDGLSDDRKKRCRLVNELHQAAISKAMVEARIEELERWRTFLAIPEIRAEIDSRLAQLQSSLTEEVEGE